MYFFKLKNVCQFNYSFGWACLMEDVNNQPKNYHFFAPWAGLFYIIFSMLGRYECLTNTTSISQDMSTTWNQPSVHLYPSKYFNSIHAGDIVRGHFKVFQIRWRRKKVSQLSHRFELLLCLPRLDPFHISCLCPCQQPCQQTPEGWEKLRHRWAVHNIVYIPDSSFRWWKLVAHWRHTGGNLKNCFRNMDSLSERNQWRKCSVNQTGGKLGANWGQTGGKLGAT